MAENLRGMGRVFRPSYIYSDPKTGEKQLRQGSVWHIEFSHNGKPRRESSKSRKESDASSFERQEFEKVLAHLSEPLQALFKVAYITGWRTKSELLTRRWKHVDFVNGKLRIEPGEDKNRSGREFPVGPELKRILEARQARAARIVKADSWNGPSVMAGP